MRKFTAVFMCVYNCSTSVIVYFNVFNLCVHMYASCLSANVAAFLA